MPVDKAQELLGLSFKSLQSGWLMAITLSLIKGSWKIDVFLLQK